MKIYINLTNFMNVNFLSGIQRVVIEILKRLLKTDNQIVLFAYDGKLDETFLIDNAILLSFLQDSKIKKETAISDKIFNLENIEPYAIYYDIDASWNNTLTNSHIYKLLKERGCKIITYIYDIVPVKLPAFSHERTIFNFNMHFISVLKYADEIHVSAAATKADIEEIAKKADITKKIETIPLASDFEKKASAEKADLRVLSKIDKIGPFLLMVGTVEPRKNHGFALDLLDLDEFLQTGQSIVIIGRMGWKAEGIKARIDGHPLLNKRLFYFDSINDATLEEIYEKAYALLFPSFYEGFGLPIVEAQAKGCPVFANDVSVLREVGGEFARYFSTDNKQDILVILQDLKENPAKYEALKEELKSFKAPIWDDVVKQMLASLKAAEGKKNHGKINLRQVLLLSARPDNLLQTLKYTEHMMEFIEEALITCPAAIIDEIKAGYSGRLSLKFMTDEELSGSRPIPKDHLTRNFYLRALSYTSDLVDDFFLVCDDDARPLFPTSESVFIKDNKINAFYFNALDNWQLSYNAPTSFDMGASVTKDWLESLSCPSLFYCSHMPQAMSKEVWRALLLHIDDISVAGLLEWTCFFNYGIKNFPHMFNRKAFKTLCWPGAPSDWDYFVYPSEFLFENFYDEYYEKDGIFAGLSKEFTSINQVIGESIKKIGIREALQRVRERELSAQGALDDEYARVSGIYPSFALNISAGTAELSAPVYLTVPSSGGLCKRKIAIINPEAADLSADLTCILSEANSGSFKTVFNAHFTLTDKRARDFHFYFKNPNTKGEHILSLVLNIGGKKIKKDIAVYGV